MEEVSKKENIKKILRFRKHLFIIFVITLAVSFFLRDGYRGVDKINSALFNQPKQTKPLTTDPIKFEKDGFQYALTPLYDYQIDALVVNRMIYDKWYSLSKTDSVFSVDLCLLWGSNITSEVYKSKKLIFSQDMRFCFYRWLEDGLPFNENEVSNNHLVIENENIEKIAKNILPGDQISIKGKLVSVVATDEENANEYSWASSTTRTDTSKGACEVLYVEKIEILKTGNPIFRFLYNISFYGILALIIFEILRFISETRRFISKTS